MVDGRMRIEFATLTDQHTFYSTTDPDLVADDASNRIFFEAHTSTTDTIVPEIDAGDEENNTQPFRAGSFYINGKTFAEGTYSTATGDYYNILSGSAVLEKSEKFTESLIKHFEGLRILTTEDQFSDSSKFTISALTGTFVITDQDLEINQGKGIYLKDLNPNDPSGAPDGIVNLENSPSIYSDVRFSHLPNYRFLPPRNLPSPGQTPDDPDLLMGSYPNFSSEGSIQKKTPTESVQEVLSTLNKRQQIIFDFEDTSIENNIIGQLFEFSHEGVEKLSLIDFGTLPYTESGEDERTKNIYFAGKLIKDSTGAQTFMNIFTLILETKE